MSKARIFLTDYASYNEGKQFEFGHWVDLDQFSDADDLQEYIKKHFAECDKKSPLYGGSPREEIMITDYEGFPRDLYSECMDFEPLFEYLNLDELEKIGFIAHLELGADVEYALEHADEVNPIEWDWSGDDKYDLFDQFYPGVGDLECSNDYLSIDYDSFIKNEFTEIEVDGITYLVPDYQLT